MCKNGLGYQTLNNQEICINDKEIYKKSFFSLPEKFLNELFFNAKKSDNRNFTGNCCILFVDLKEFTENLSMSDYKIRKEIINLYLKKLNRKYSNYGVLSGLISTDIHKLVKIIFLN